MSDEKMREALNDKFDAMCARWELTDASNNFGLLFMAFKEAWKECAAHSAARIAELEQRISYCQQSHSHKMLEEASAHAKYCENKMEEAIRRHCDASDTSIKRIAELEGQVSMLRESLNMYGQICRYYKEIKEALSATAQTAEQYKHRVQAEALEDAARHIERFGKHVGWHHAAKDWPTDARQAIEVFSEHESAELMRMASELRNQAEQAEGKESK